MNTFVNSRCPSNQFLTGGTLNLVKPDGTNLIRPGISGLSSISCSEGDGQPSTKINQPNIFQNSSDLEVSTIDLPQCVNGYSSITKVVDSVPETRVVGLKVRCKGDDRDHLIGYNENFSTYLSDLTSGIISEQQIGETDKVIGGLGINYTQTQAGDGSVSLVQNLEGNNFQRGSDFFNPTDSTRERIDIIVMLGALFTIILALILFVYM